MIPNEAINHIAIKTYGKIYSFLYDNGYPVSLVDVGAAIIKRDTKTLDWLQEAMSDFIISDREYAAYAVWYYHFNRLKMLDILKDEYAIDYMEGVLRAA